MATEGGDPPTFTLMIAPLIRWEICAQVEKRLREAGSSAVTTDESVAQLRALVDAVLADVETLVRRGEPTSDPRISLEIGASQASNRVPPIESLYAADVLFEIALAALASTPAVQAPQQALWLALCLHQSIMRRLGLGADAYVNCLLQRMQDSYHEERRRVARELHDRPSHGIGVALQGLEMHELYAESDPERAAARLRTARESLHEAIESISSVVSGLRDVLAGRDLSQAVNDYLTRFAPPWVRTSAEFIGDLQLLPPATAEQLYLVLREALHNAFLHAHPSMVRVRVEIGQSEMTMEVTDDGVGFEPARITGAGLVSMRERLELLGGNLRLASDPGRGVTVRIVVPLVSQHV